MSHHLTICFASQRNQWQTSSMDNNAGTFRRKGRVLVLWVTKPEICTRFDRYWYGRFLEGFLALSFNFLHFIHGSTIGFSMKIERLITGEKKVNFSCISTSSAATATPYIFWRKVCGKNRPRFLCPSIPKRLRFKENNTKYRSLTWKPQSHVKILMYRTWPIDKV